jgi:NAD(P)-dependent dehydrogenase (short-subunit alcohol dehydrogenase family)
VNCIVPGFVAQQPPRDDEEVAARKQRGRFITARRLGEAWELGPLAVFLCSDASSYVTGEAFSIDGGGLAGGIAPTGYAVNEPAEVKHG